MINDDDDDDDFDDYRDGYGERRGLGGWGASFSGTSFVSLLFYLKNVYGILKKIFQSSSKRSVLYT